MVHEDNTTAPFTGFQGPKCTENLKLKSDIDPNDAGCCGIPVISWYPSKKLKEKDQTEAKSSSRARACSITSGIYNLFSCASPRICSVGSCLFCDSTSSQRKVLKGPKVPNAVYTEVVVNEPIAPQGSCFGWYAPEHVPTSEHVSDKKGGSPIYKQKSLGTPAENLEPMMRSRHHDVDDVITQAPLGMNTSQAAAATPAAAVRTPTTLGKSPIIPWRTEFTGRRVIIEEIRDVGDLEECDVLFGGQTMNRDETIEEEDEDENEALTGGDSEVEASPTNYRSKEYRICFVESDAESTKDNSDSESADDVNEAGGDISEMVEIPLTPYQFDKNSWNGRLELMGE